MDNQDQNDQGHANRVTAARDLRIALANQDASTPAAKNVNNGDEARYPDKGGTYSKGLPHDDFGRVDLAAFASLKKALASGKFADFEAIKLGNPGPPGTLNGPQGGLAFDLEGHDPVQFGPPEVPPAPPIASDQTATELLEHYWGALLRDVAFTDYATNALAAEAAHELTGLKSYLGPRDAGGRVTPELLFRGDFPGERQGPYLSQFFVQPTSLGAQPVSQMMESLAPGVDYLTQFEDWKRAQNGVVTLDAAKDSQLRFRRNGRDLAAFSRVDVLFQAYLTALLVANTMHVPVNPGNPYARSKIENGFGTFGQPDFAGTLCEVATRALNAVWFQKWMVHLRPRPEATGGLVHLIKSGLADKTDVKLSNVILNSVGLQRSHDTFKGSWLLPQAFPEGSPIHPAYPTGHGTVGGACITVLKFFFDGSQKLRPLLTKIGRDVVVPTADGQKLETYTGADREQLDVNGELAKLAHNVTFGHGIHAGIHWRSDSDTSILLGEAVALAFLRDRARIYNEPFTVTLTKFDGSPVTISNR